MLKLGRKAPKQERSKETVEAIFGAVTHILNKEGAEQLNTNKIAEVAGVSVGSLYQYFKNKESIYEGILMRLVENNLKNLEQNILTMKPEGRSIRQIIDMIIRSQFENFQKMDKVATVLLSYAPKVLPPSHFQKVDEKMIRFLMEQVERHNVMIRPVDRETAFFVCSQAVRSVILMAFLGREAEERERAMVELIDMLATYLEVRD